MRLHIRYFLILTALPLLSIFIVNISKSREKKFIKRIDEKYELYTKSNHKCSLPLINYSSVIAFDYIKSDYERLKYLFEECNSTLRRDNLIDIISHDDLYEIKIKLNKFKETFNIDRPNCTLQLFDKTCNTSEIEQKLTFNTTFSFIESLDYKITLKNHGFYLIECFKYISSTKHIYYEDILNILPLDMSKLQKNEYSINDSSFKPNILIFTFDSLSKNHFKRVFPLTNEYLSNKLERNIIFDNLNSVGEK